MTIGIFELHSVAVIGGGFSGTMVAVNISRMSGGEIKVYLIEKSGEFARGVAYGTKNPLHLLNVMASNVSAFPDVPDDFVEWLGRDDKSYYPRRIYGDYLESILASTRNVEKIAAEALDLQIKADDVLVVLADGKNIKVDAAVLALGNLPPGANRYEKAVERLRDQTLLNPWGETEKLAKVRDESRILIIGMALTAVDMITSLTAENSTRKIVAVSRHGLLPQPHVVDKPAFEIEVPVGISVAQMLRFLRREIDGTERKNIPWQSVIDALRPHTISLWQSLTLKQKAQFVRHLRSYWDTRRHRTPPETFAQLRNLQESGQLEIMAGRVLAIKALEKDFAVTIMARGAEKAVVERFDYIINCVTPENDYESNSLMKNLFARGVVKQGILRMGVKTGSKGGVCGNDDVESTQVFAIGPMRKGDLWETVAVPELRVQAWDLAKVIVEKLL